MGELFKRHLLKMLSVVFAMILWFYVLNSESLVIERKIPVEFLLPPDRAMANEVSRDLMVKLKGPRVLLRNIFAEGTKVTVDVTKVIVEDNTPVTFIVKNADIPLPFGVELISHSPRQFEISLQRKVVRRVGVKIMTIGKLEEDLKIIYQKIVPRFLTVEGPEELTRELPHLSTAPVDLTNLKGEDTIILKIMGNDPRIKIRDTDEIKYSYVVRSKKANMMFHGIRIRYLTTRRKFTAETNVASISILATEERLNKSDFQVIADLPEGVIGRQKIKLRAILPEGLHLLSITPDEIWVELY